MIKIIFEMSFLKSPIIKKGLYFVKCEYDECYKILRDSFRRWFIT